MSYESDINRAATEAMAHAMYAYTYGIVGDARHGLEGRGLGTGIGIHWRDGDYILTAAHTVEATPYERMYFFLPSESLVIADSFSSINWSRVQQRERLQLENPRVVLDPKNRARLIPIRRLPQTAFWKPTPPHPQPHPPLLRR
jgi:hypothetical protein